MAKKSTDKNKNLAFRRIHGRIIPIRLDRGQKEIAKGAGIVATGAAVSISGGRAFAKLSTKAIDSALTGLAWREKVPKEFGNGQKLFRSSKQLSFDDMLARNALNNANKAQAAAKRFAKSAQVVRKAAPFVGAGIAAYGATKIVSGLARKGKLKKLNKHLTAALGAGAAAAATYAAKNADELFTTSAISGKKEALKTLAKEAGPKVAHHLLNHVRKKYGI